MTDPADRAGIAELLADYARAVDTKDWELYKSVFSADAVVDYTSSGGPRGTREQVAEWVSSALEPFTMTQHLVTNLHVEVEGDNATCRSDYYNPMGMPDGAGRLALFFVGGLYLDRLRRSEGGWLITERVEEMLWITPTTRGRDHI
ncbi:MAG: nuclear transport factor 2 family protein [Acidimicrobiales bacterium]